MPLDRDQEIHLAAAQGFVRLGMYLDADAALDDIDPFCRHLPEVLAVRVQIYEKLERWELIEAVARRLAEFDPGNPEWWASWAQATSQTESLDAARRILVSALDEGLDEAVIHFNLACCECRLGDFWAAREHLRRCFEIDPRWRLKALENPELEAVRGEE